MAKTRKYRWKCPECGTGKLLSSRPRKNATDRYCIPCSVESGTLTERVCPTLDKKREQRDEIRRAKAKADTQRRQKARAASKAKAAEQFIVQGIDLEKELKRLWKIASKIEPQLNRNVPSLTVTRRRIKGWNKGTSGRAYFYQHRIHLSCGTDPADIVHVLAHEVAHFVALRRGDNGHGDIFKTANKELHDEAGITRPSYRSHKW